MSGLLSEDQEFFSYGRDFRDGSSLRRFEVPHFWIHERAELFPGAQASCLHLPHNAARMAALPGECHLDSEPCQIS